MTAWAPTSGSNRRGELDAGGAGDHPFRTHRRRGRRAPLVDVRPADLARAAEAREDDPAAFLHLGTDALPQLEGEGKQVRLILGHAWGAVVPLAMPSEVFYADARLAPGAAIPLPDDHEDRGIYVLDGQVTCAGQVFEAGRMLVFPPRRPRLGRGRRRRRADHASGRRHDGRPALHLVDFVASSKERIEPPREAWRAGDWQHGRFRLPPGDDADISPAPDR